MKFIPTSAPPPPWNLRKQVYHELYSSMAQRISAWVWFLNKSNAIGIQVVPFTAQSQKGSGEGGKGHWGKAVCIFNFWNQGFLYNLIIQIPSWVGWQQKRPMQNDPEGGDVCASGTNQNYVLKFLSLATFTSTSLLIHTQASHTKHR